MSARRKDDAPLAVGSQAVATRRIGPRELLTTEEITELTPPRTWEVRGVGGILVIAIAIGTIEPLDGGNRSLVTIALRFEGHGIGKLLVALGLVRPTGRGVVVVLEAADVDHAYRVRAALEALTAELAAGRQGDGRIAPADLASLREVAAAAADATTAGWLVEAVGHNRRFHRRIAELAGNPIALQTLDRVWDPIQVFTLHSLAPPARRAHVAAQHGQLLAAITGARAGGRRPDRPPARPRHPRHHIRRVDRKWHDSTPTTPS